jgi:hypothetical protein
VIAAVAGPQDEPKTYTEPLVSEGCPVLWYDYEFATPDSDLPARLSVRHPDINDVCCFVSVAFGRKPPPLVFGGSGEGGEGEQSATEPVFVEFKLRLSARDH